MPRLRNEDIDNIRSKADIVDVIGRYIPVERKGNSYRAVCPFHDDHSPSLNISQAKQMYKCFACGAGGNVFKFVGEFENLGFVESVIKVAEMVNYPLEVEAEKVPVIDNAKDRSYKCLNDVISYTTFALKSEMGIPYKSYLEKRGIDENIIETFQIGYNGPKEVVYRFLKAKGYSDKEMNEVNLIRITPQGTYDVFSDRIMFPIHDSFGNPIGFTARTLNKDQSKYINTSQTNLYTKGDIVYNFHRAKQSAKKMNQLIVCEGVMDVIAYAKAGITNVVATLGTALTPHQLNLMKQCSMNLLLSYDGDDAGQNAIYKAGKIAKEAGFNVMVYANTTKMDPDEIVSSLGKEALVNMVSHPKTWMEFLFQHLQTKYNFDVYSDKKAYALELMEEISKCQDDYDRLNYSHQLSSITGFDVQGMIKTKKENPEHIKTVGSIKVDGLRAAQFDICSAMIKSADAIETYMMDLGYLPDPTLHMLAITIIDDYRKYGKVDPSRMMDRIMDETVKQCLLELCSNPLYSNEFDKGVLDGAIRKIKIATLENRTKELQNQLKTLKNTENRQNLVIELSESLRKLRQFYDEKE